VNDDIGMKVMKKILNVMLLAAMSRRGYTAYGIFELRDRIVKDLLYNRQQTLMEKLRAYRKGFLSHTAKDYGITDENYRSFISDFEYYKLYPINKKFGHLIDDKITLRLVLAPFAEYLPRYYFHIVKPGLINSLMDMDAVPEPDVRTIIDLLKCEGDLAVKMVSGEKGAGFYRITHREGNFFVNGRDISENEMEIFLSRLENYLVVEYLSAHPDISRIYGGSPNTLRVMMINEEGRRPYVANGLMRVGRNATGAIEAITANGGGIFAIVDIQSGRYHSAKRLENYHAVDCIFHPDTNEKVEGMLPRWDQIEAKLIEICEYLPQLVYMGFDVVITEDDFKILEINSMQGVNFYQYYYPLLIGNPASSFYKALLKR